jgi:hypothetical protein
VLLALDAAAFHKTIKVKKKLKDKNIVPALVPPGCTGILQPLDTAVNKPFKEILQEETEMYIDNWKDQGDSSKWTTSQKRIMVTYVVVAAWERFCTTKQELIQKAFRDVGLSISPCGKDDHLLSIKGYDHGKPKIGDWSHIELIDSVGLYGIAIAFALGLGFDVLELLFYLGSRWVLYVIGHVTIPLV